MSDLKPCPFCGTDDDIDPTGVLNGDGTRSPECMGCGATAPTVATWNCRIAAPAEDVRAVVEEPARNEQTVYLILFDDYDVRPETVIGEAAARQRYAQLSNSWNAHLFVKLESNSRDDAHANSNYRHPQRPVVLPERKRDSCEDSDVLTDAQAEGWNACLHEVERLNK